MKTNNNLPGTIHRIFVSVCFFNNNLCISIGLAFELSTTDGKTQTWNHDKSTDPGPYKSYSFFIHFIK